METLGFDRLGKGDWIDYKDENVIVAYDLINKLPSNSGDSFKLGVMAIVFCGRGRLQLDIDGITHTLQSNEALVCPTGSVLSNYMMSPDLKMFAIGMSPKALDKKVFSEKNFWKYAEYITKHHIIPLAKEDMVFFIRYYELGKALIDNPTKPHRDQIIYHLQQIVIYEFINILERHIPQEEIPAHEVVNQGDLLFKRFITKLAASEGKIHQVSDFANELNISAKYLSVVVKNTSGKTALQLIHETMLKEIEQQLKFTDKSIKEIASDLNFQNLSFFGKFVKSHLGTSPKEYRMNFKRSI